MAIEVCADVANHVISDRRLKQERWADILASEPPGRAAGRRPRDPEQEALLTELDRLRIERSEILARARRVPMQPSE